MYGHASSSSSQLAPTGLTEFDILKASHKFLHEDGEAGRKNGETSNNPIALWGDRLAKKYYSSLYKEFAVCDLKHYKSGNFALRWRTEDEVISGAGEETCGNTRCPLHIPPPSEAAGVPRLKTVELPFAYEEHGEYKSALVKVVLCEGCLRKLMWKREKEKKERGRFKDGKKDDEETEEESGVRGEDEVREREEKERGRRDVKEGGKDDGRERRAHERRKEQHEEEGRKRRRSRSRSPSSHRRKREHKDKSRHRQHHRSPSR